MHEHKEHGLSDVINDRDVSNGEYGLIIVPDAGTNDFEFIEQLKTVGTSVLIIDHHLKNEETLISDNCVLVNN
jgi:single-stranded DNA-specific DHH superfamily exonuclease